MQYKTDNALLLKGIPFFSGLSDTDIQWFSDRTRVVEYSKKSSLFQRGDAAENMFIIIEGWVKIFHINRDGEETVQAILTRHDSFGEEASLDESDYQYSAQVAGSGVKCMIVPAPVIRNKIRTDPSIAIKILSTIMYHFNQTGLMYDYFTKLTAAQRLAAFILKLSMDRGNPETIQLPYNKILVASRLCMQPETFSRAIKRLSDDTNTIFKGREVIIHDVKELQEYCEVFCGKARECTFEEKLTCTDHRCDLFRLLKLM